jgi:hypothetical protein
LGDGLLGPTVSLLPEHVRGRERERDDGPAERPSSAQRPSWTDGEQRHHHHRSHQSDLGLRLHADPDHDAGNQDTGGALTEDRPDQQPGERGRAQQVESGRRDDVADCQREP